MHPLSQPWLISDEGLQLVLGVWSRGAISREALHVAQERYRLEYGDEPMHNRGRKGLEVRDGVAVVPIFGPLFRRADMLADVSGATSYARIGRSLDEALDSSEARAIVLQIDSPGGEAHGVAELANRIHAARARKPMVAYVEGAGCSAAYWLASAAGEIVCDELAVLGSLGARCVLTDDRGRQEKDGVREIEIVSSQSPGKRGQPVDDDVRARAQARLDALADVFLASVARYRGVSPAKVAADFGKGDMLVGAGAVAAGLADRLGSLETTINNLRGRGAARTGVSMSTTKQDEVELVPRTELQAAQAQLVALQGKLDAVQPLLSQVAAITGREDLAGQQAALAQIQVQAARADELQKLVGDERDMLMAQARAKKIPPVAMAGWQHLSLAALREVVEKTPGAQTHAPAGKEQVAEPAEGTGAELTDQEYVIYQAAGAKTREEAAAMKAEGIALAGKKER